jgi:hypothetical protein
VLLEQQVSVVVLVQLELLEQQELALKVLLERLAVLERLA